MARQTDLEMRRVKSPSRRASTVVSVVLHAGVLLMVFNMSLGMTIEEEEKEKIPERTIEAVLIKLPPTPEPAGSESGAGTPVDDKPKSARPKALAKRVVQANVSQVRNIVQQQITRVAPTPVLGQVNKVDVAPVKVTQAPKSISQRNVVTRAVSPLGDVQPYQVSSGPAASTAKIREAPTLNQTAGPKKMDAAGPVKATSALSYQQPTVAEGVVGDVTVQGDPDGPNIRILEPGSGSAYFDGAGGRGSGSGGGDGNGTSGSGPGNGTGSGGGGSGSGKGNLGPRDCSKDRQCQAYLEMIRQRVYGRWNPASGVSGGEVRLSFRIDRSGAAHEIAVVKSDNGQLGDSCVTAFRHANPFPPPPASIAYLLDKNIIAIFDFARGGG
jgi:uncharacterized membrane protein YgcG